MKRVTITIEYDDTGCYQGHGPVEEVIESLLHTLVMVDLEGEGIVNPGTTITVHR